MLPFSAFIDVSSWKSAYPNTHDSTDEGSFVAHFLGRLPITLIRAPSSFRQHSRMTF